MKQIDQPDGEHQIEHLDDMSGYLNKNSGEAISTGSQGEHRGHSDVHTSQQPLEVVHLAVSQTCTAVHKESTCNAEQDKDKSICTCT